MIPETPEVAAFRGDEVHAPLLANPYPPGSPEAAQYENGYEYAQSLGHQVLNQRDPMEWHARPGAWRAGFAKAAGGLGLKQYEKLACAGPVAMFDIDGTLVDESQGWEGPQVLLPGRLEMLRALKAHGVRMYCITNRSAYPPNGSVERTERRNEEVLDMCEGLIDQVYWLSTPGPLLKPSGFMLRACMEQNGVDPAQAIYVGNAESDEAAALDAGVPYADQAEFFAAGKDAEWSSDANRDAHAAKHGPEFGSPEAYLSFEKALRAHPELMATFRPVNTRCDERGCTTGAYSPVLRMKHVVNEDGKTVTLFHTNRP